MHGYVTIMRLPSDCGMALMSIVDAFLELHMTHVAASAILNVPVFDGKNKTIPLYTTSGNSAYPKILPHLFKPMPSPAPMI